MSPRDSIHVDFSSLAALWSSESRFLSERRPSGWNQSFQSPFPAGGSLSGGAGQFDVKPLSHFVREHLLFNLNNNDGIL